MDPVWDSNLVIQEVGNPVFHLVNNHFLILERVYMKFNCGHIERWNWLFENYI